MIKDLFDHVDIRKDGLIDLNEWQQTFGAVVGGSKSLSIKQNENLPGLTRWENSEEYKKMGNLFAKNRKQLIEAFQKVLSPADSGNGTSNTAFTFAQGKKALDDWLYQNFKWDLTKPGEE